MENPDDFDGDGDFNALDISILDDDTGTRRPSQNGGGCFVLLLVLGSAIGGCCYEISHLLLS